MANDKYTLDVAINAADAANSLKDVKQSLRDLKNIQLEFGEGTEEYIKASEKIGILKDKLNDANDTARVLSGNMTENLTGAFSRVATAGIGAFQAVEGAQAVFGVENEDLQKQMVKLQGLLNLSQGIKEFANIGQAAKDFKVVLGVLLPATVAQTAATEGAAVAQTSLNAAMAANPIGAVVAALALLVGAIVLFTNSTDESKKQLDELDKSERKFNESIKETNTTIDRRLKNLRDNLELSRLDGKEKELRAADIQKENALLDLNVQKQKEVGLVITQLFLLQRKLREETSKDLTQKKDKQLILELENQIQEAEKKGVQLLIKNEQAQNLIIEQAEQDKLNIEKKYQKLAQENQKKNDDNKEKEEEQRKKKAEQREKEAIDQLERNGKTQLGIQEKYKRSQQEVDDLYAEIAATGNYKTSELIYQEIDKRLKAEEEGFAASIKRSQEDQQRTEELNKNKFLQLDIQKEFNKSQQEVDDLYAEIAQEGRLKESDAIYAEIAKRLKAKKEASDKEKEIDEKTRQANIDAVQNGLSTIANLAQLFAGKSEKAQKRAFDIQKAANIAGAIVETYRSATGAYASQLIPGEPTSVVRAKIAAAAAVAAGLLNIKRIKDQKFNSPATGGGAGGENISSAPTTLQSQTTVTTGQFAGFGEFKPGELTDRRVYVVESDITGVQRKIQVIEDRSKF